LYYKKEWVPREVHKDFLGVLLTVLMCKTSVCSLQQAVLGRNEGLTWVLRLDNICW
jgi:hypothetical protein